MLLKTAKRLIVFVVGMTVILIGIPMIFTPFSPAIIVIPAGLAILASEFVWARRLLRKARSAVADGRKRGWREGWKTLVGIARPGSQKTSAGDTKQSDSSTT